MGKPVIETGITAHESQADFLKYLFSFKKKKMKTIIVLFCPGPVYMTADSLTLSPLGPTGPTGPGSPVRPWEQKNIQYVEVYFFLVRVTD